MWFGDIGEHLVPIMGILMIIAIVVGPGWIRNYYASRERDRMHETLRVALEKGQSLPPELLESLRVREPDAASAPASKGGDGDLRRGIVLVAVGLGLAGLGSGFGYGLPGIAGPIVGGIVAGAGAIPGMIGLAYLALWVFGRRGRV